MQLISCVRFIVTPEGVEMEPDRVCRIAKWPYLTRHCHIKVFLGFANFYRRFIRSFLCLAKQMTDMLRGERMATFRGPSYSL
jgi:hypothetical protein